MPRKSSALFEFIGVLTVGMESITDAPFNLAAIQAFNAQSERVLARL